MVALFVLFPAVDSCIIGSGPARYRRGIQQQIGAATALSVDYVGSHGSLLPRRSNYQYTSVGNTRFQLQ
jgi:hypothetical protein